MFSKMTKSTATYLGHTFPKIKEVRGVYAPLRHCSYTYAENDPNIKLINIIKTMKYIRVK